MKNSKSIYLTFYIASVLVVNSFSQTQSKDDTKFPSASQFKNSTFSFKIIDAPNKTFGYDIYADNKIIIHQTSIPSKGGNDGFSDQALATKVAELVIKKIKNGEMPPSVTSEEITLLILSDK